MKPTVVNLTCLPDELIGHRLGWCHKCDVFHDRGAVVAAFAADVLCMNSADLGVFLRRWSSMDDVACACAGDLCPGAVVRAILSRRV